MICLIKIDGMYVFINDIVYSTISENDDTSVAKKVNRLMTIHFR